MKQLFVDPICDAFETYAKRQSRQACDLPQTLTIGEVVDRLGYVPAGIRPLDYQVTVKGAVDALLGDLS